jgi:hypothetical protein
MITDTNQVLFGKMSSCGLQEVLDGEFGGVRRVNSWLVGGQLAMTNSCSYAMPYLSSVVPSGGTKDGWHFALCHLPAKSGCNTFQQTLS